MASLLRTLSLSARALVPKSVMGAFAIRGPSSMLRATPSLFDSNATSLMAPTSGAMGAVAQQTRGMKVQSSVKKRCEHCKVVRRKAGKRHNGHLYIICKANPRHKQRQG